MNLMNDESEWKDEHENVIESTIENDEISE